MTDGRSTRGTRVAAACRPRPSSARALPALALGAALLATGCGLPRRDAVHRLPAPYNFAFYRTHTEAARSFYAAHYAHFGTYEALLRAGGRYVDAAEAHAGHGEPPAGAEGAGAPPAGAEGAGVPASGEAGSDADPMEALRRRILRYVERPPRFEPPAEIIAPGWSKMAYETGRSMDWTHVLHRQLYDILTDDRVTGKREAGERAIAYYLLEGSAFSTRGYGHRWMEGGGPWAGEFRRRWPAINGILWAYHWHHAAVYEALMEPDSAARRRELERVIRVFRDSVLADPPEVMPLTGEVAPRFSRLLPAAAHIFDNLHMMHDVANDVMADPSLERAEKAAEIERLRRAMTYAGQDTVAAPALPMHGEHEMGEGSMRVPTRLPDGTWLPQGHPEARRAPMEELMRPLPAPSGDG